MNILENFGSLPWCNSDWSIPNIDKDSEDLVKQCSSFPAVELLEDVLEVIKNSKDFPVIFPINTIRLEKLKEKRSLQRLKNNIVSTYPLIHERVLLLMARFLTFKREFGTNIEKVLYKDLSIPDLIDRILTKRAVTFMGRRDKYKLLSGETGQEGWESVGTDDETPPLLLENCLSYDEMKLSSFVYVSGYTECINDGSRRNKGIVQEDNIEENAVIIGVIGPRFKRKNRMEFEDVILSEEQNTPLNGFGVEARNNPSAKHLWRRIWEEFYEVSSLTYSELKAKAPVKDKPEGARYTDRYVKIPRSKNVFDNEVYYKRICVTAECALLEAEARAAAEGRYAFLNVIGAGLGVWRATPHQNDVYVLTFLERVWSLLNAHRLNNVADVNLAYIQPTKDILDLFTDASSSGDETAPVKKIFFKNEDHQKGGINVQLSSRNPSSNLTGEHSGKLLVMTYAWDGNAHPGNEFWIGKLDTSGDPAAACSTQVSELHNAHINPAVRSHNTRIVGSRGLQTIQNYTISS